MLKDPEHPMSPGTSLKMCPVASVDVFVQQKIQNFVKFVLIDKVYSGESFCKNLLTKNLIKKKLLHIFTSHKYSFYSPICGNVYHIIMTKT